VSQAIALRHMLFLHSSKFPWMLAGTVISITTNKHIHLRHVCNQWIYGSGSVVKVLKTGLAVYPNTDIRPENRLV